MPKIRCDADILPSLKFFCEYAGIPAEITDDTDFDICIFSKLDAEIINNLNSHVIIIANGDDPELLHGLDGIKNTIITCGMSAVSTLTLSSTCDGDFVVCLQRAIPTLSGHILGFREIPVHLGEISMELCHLILLLALCIICGINIDELRPKERNDL